VVPHQADALLEDLRSEGLPAAIVGEICDRTDPEIRVC
jgi:hypothetical protein